MTELKSLYKIRQIKKIRIMNCLVSSWFLDIKVVVPISLTSRNRIISALYLVNQCFLNHGSSGLCGWVAKACKLSRANEKDLCAEDLRSEEPS